MIFQAFGSKYFKIVLALIVTLVIVESVILLFYRETWLDEEIVLNKSMLLIKSEAKPFVDLIIEYPPLFIPFYGLSQLWGPDLHSGRAISLIFLFLSLFLIFRIVGKIVGRNPAILAILFMMGNVLLIGNYVTATFYSMSAFILTLFVYAHLFASQKNKFFMTGIIAGLLMLTRTNMIIVPLIYLVFLFYNQAKIGDFFKFIGTFLATLVLGYLPIVIGNPEVALSYILYPLTAVGPLSQLPPSNKTVVTLVEVWSNAVAFFKEYFSVLVFFFGSVVAALFSERGKWRMFISQEKNLLFLVVLSIVFIASHYFYWRVESHINYSNYFIPLLVIVATILYFKFVPRNATSNIFLIFIILFTFASNAWRVDVVSSPREESDIARLKRGARFIEENTKKGDTIVTFDNSVYHVFLADRKIPNALINRNFLFVANAPKELLSKLGMYNIETMNQWLDEANYLLIHKERWPSSFIRMPFFGESPTFLEDMKKLQMKIDVKYRIVGEILNVYPRKYTEGNDGGTLVLYKRISK